MTNIARGRQGETILVVEDEADARASTCGILRELGYDVVEAPNGGVALDLLEQHPEIKLLFIDVGLPGGMNGRQLAETARQRRPALKVLFTTGYAGDGIVHGGLLDPGVPLIARPFTHSALAEKLRSILDAAAASPRVLLVEDEVLIQMVMSEELGDLGFTVEIAGNAAEAKTTLRALNGEVDAAIVDMGLPDANGDELVRDLRAMYPALPVVIASGHDKATLQRLFAGHTSMGFLSKPYTAESLRASLHAIGVSAPGLGPMVLPGAAGQRKD